MEQNKYQWHHAARRPKESPKKYENKPESPEKPSPVSSKYEVVISEEFYIIRERNLSQKN